MTANQVDPAFAALLADPRAALRPPRSGQPLADYRRRLNAPMSAAEGPPVAAVETLNIGTTARPLMVRSYHPPQPRPGAILFIHGGGFVIGSLETHDALCRSLTLESQRRVVAVEYRLAPEAPFPAAMEDCRTALNWLMIEQLAEPVALAGDSAGAHLAVRTVLDAGRRGKVITALGLLYPVVDPVCATASWERIGEGYVLTRDWMRWAWAGYLAGVDPSDPRVSLLNDDLSGLPPTLIVTAAFDPLHDEGEALGAAIVEVGGKVTTQCIGGTIHGFASLPMLTPRAGEAVRTLADHLNQHMC